MKLIAVVSVFVVALLYWAGASGQTLPPVVNCEANVVITLEDGSEWSGRAQQALEFCLGTSTIVPTVQASATAVLPSATPLPTNTLGPTFTPPPTATVFATATVNPGSQTLIVPDQFATILAAYQAANAGDTIAIREGFYNEMLDIRKNGLTITTFGSGIAWFDGECLRAHGILITGATDVTVRNIGVRRTLNASIRADPNVNFGNAARTTIDGNRLQDFNCNEVLSAQSRAGVAFNQTGNAQRVLNNVITRRVDLPGIQRGHGNGIWFKSDGAQPSGGGHLIQSNVITGGYDGIGGETEGSIHGSFDGNTLITGNHIMGCGDDGIQTEGNNANVRVINNLIEECGIGVAFANNVVGPLYVENNTIISSSPRWNPAGTLDVLACYKVGNGSQQQVFLTGNVCTVNYPGDPALPATRRGDGVKQTNSGLSIYVLRNNIFNVSRYVYEFNGTPQPGSSFDFDCLNTNDPTRFMQWAGNSIATLAQFQAQTGQELNGTTGPC